MASNDPDKRAKWIDELLERKEFSEIWVKKWAELLQVRTDPIAERQPQGDVPLLQLAGRQALEEHADGRDGPGAPGRQRRHVQERGDQLLPDHQRDPAADRERRPGLHGHAGPVRPVPQPPVRPLDPGRLLQLRRLLRPDRPQAGRGLPRDDHLQLRRRRGESPGRRPCHAARSSSAARSPTSAARTAGSILAKWLASPENPWFATSFANRVWAHFLGSGSSSRSTTSASATRPRTPSCSRPWASISPRPSTTSRPWSATSATRGRTSAHDPRTRATRADERNFAHALVRRIKAESLLDTISAVTDTKDKFDGLPLGARAVQIADGTRTHLLPHDLRPGDPRDRLLVRGEDGAHALAGASTSSTATRSTTRSGRAA